VEVLPGDMTDAELDLLRKQWSLFYDQNDRNMVYSNNPHFTKEEKSKNIFFYRDRKI
jgi:hypothetical protein